MMHIKERYRRLNFWHKVGFWGAIVSILSPPLGLLLSWCMSPDTTKIVHLLEDEFRKQLGAKDLQIEFLQGQLERIQQAEEPSQRARALAAKIPAEADSYALGIKAIAEKRFDDARKLLAEAQEIKEVELSRIYAARGQTEIFAVRYTDAITWYQKALALRPDDASLLSQTALAFYYVGKYAEAEPLYLRSLEIREKAVGKEHPNVIAVRKNYTTLLKVKKNKEGDVSQKLHEGEP